MDMKLLGLLEESLRQSWQAQERLEDRMRQVVHAMDRNNELLRALNVTMTRLSEHYGGLMTYLRGRGSDEAG